MVNPWILHIKEYAKKNNVSYACALSKPDIKEGYQTSSKKSKKEKDDEKAQFYINQNINILKNRVKNMEENDKPILRMKFNSYNSQVKEGFKSKYPKYYDKLFN